MISVTKKIIKSLIPQSYWNNKKKQKDQKDFEEWEKNGRPDPPPHLVKQNAITFYQKKYGYTTLVETGTYLGDMVEAQKGRFKKIFSIELGVDLHARAVKRFRNDKHVTIVQGDSGKVLPQVLKQINEPAIFWLDGHYSAGITAQGEKDCPIFEEIDAIFSAKKFDHVILVDDARCFLGQGDYPTIEKLTEYIQKKNPSYKVEVKDDSIRYTI